MKVLFISIFFHPHIGGVEKHILEVGKKLSKKGQGISLITQKCSNGFRSNDSVLGIGVFRFSYPTLRFLGIAVIWLKMLFKYSWLIQEADIVQIHDVFIWYLPFCFLFPRKKVYITHHGWEGKYPVPFKNKLYKKIANKLSNGSICVGKYLEEHYGIKCDEIVYGGVNVPTKTSNKEKKIMFLGRLEMDTGLVKALTRLKEYKNKGYEVDFVGGGSLRGKCEKIGKVHGFTDPEPFLRKAEVCIPSGYLSCLEAFVYKCRVEVFWHNKLKKDYWQMTPFYKYIRKQDINGAYNWVKTQSWEKLTKKYIKLWT